MVISHFLRIVSDDQPHFWVSCDVQQPCGVYILFISHFLEEMCGDQQPIAGSMVVSYVAMPRYADLSHFDS